jgi:hypothetical protein
MGFVFGAKKLPIGAAPDTLGVMELLAAKVPLINRLAVAVQFVILLLAAASGSLIGLSPCFMATVHSFGAASRRLNVISWAAPIALRLNGQRCTFV